MNPGRLRILHVITGLEVGGAEMSLRNLVLSMDRSRFENAVLSLTTRGELGEEIERGGIEVSAMGLRRGVPDPRAIVRLARAVRSFRPDLVQTWLYHADLLGGITSRLVSFPPVVWNVRCANTIAADGDAAVSPLMYRILSRLSSVPAAVVVNSEAGMRVHEAIGYRPRRWELIPNGFDLDRFVPDEGARRSLREELGLPGHALLAGLVARFDALKDHATFLRAAALVAERHDVHLVLAGAGIDSSNEVLRNAAASRGLTSRTHFLGPRRDVSRVTAALDVACSSSVGEGFPNTIGEAMSCAVPVVATDVGDTAWLLGEDAGLVVAPSDPEAFARGLSKMLSMTEAERRAIGEKGRQRIISHFSLPAIVRRYEVFYETIAGAPHVD